MSVIFSENYFSYVTAPVLQMRAAPSSSSEVVSQAFFSERIKPLEEKDGWMKIETLVDQYKGWVHAPAFIQRETPFLGMPANRSVRIARCSAHVYAQPDTIYGPLLTLPFESELELIKETDSQSRWLEIGLPDGKHAFVQRGDVCITRSICSRDEMCVLSYSFLGLPYTWGGRSSFGYDCSGFVQMLYRQMEIFLPRDSKDQCQFAQLKEVALAHMQPGDLIFFGFAKDAIRHVGLYLGQSAFIHTVASIENAPYLRISHLSDPAWNGSGYYPYFTARTFIN